MSFSYIKPRPRHELSQVARAESVDLPEKRAARIDGEPARLGRRAQAVLRALAARQERVVSRAELIAAVWPHERVNENNLNVQIAALRKALGPTAIATIPGRGYQLTLPDASPGVLRAQSQVAPPVDNPLTNLPSVQSELLGRAADLDELQARLGEQALITIIGAGGIGKTRVAMEAARTRVAMQADGVWWVELANLAPGADADAVARAVAATIGLSLGASQQPGEALRPLAALVVLDNAEHVAPAVAQLVDSLRTASALRWLVTSQVPLKLAQEQPFALGALAVPPAEATLEQALGHGAVALLAQRAQAANHRYELSAAELPAAIAICRRLDGIALAIELAASRLAWLGADALERRLARGPRGLSDNSHAAPTRQQTLQATLDWSHALLAPAERAVLRRLGVFVGGFTLQTAQHVAADDTLDEWGVLDALSGLADKSWVQVGKGDAPRYHLLESARLYALEQLAQADETDAVRVRHCEAMDALAGQHFGQHWSLPPEALAALVPEWDNFVAAFDHSLHARQADAAARLFAAVLRTSTIAGRPPGSRELVIRANALAPMLSGLPATPQAHALAAIAIAMPQFDPLATERFQRSVALVRHDSAERDFVFYLLSFLVRHLARAGSLDEARELAAQARAMHDGQRPRYLVAQFVLAEAMLSSYSGDFEAALRQGRLAVAHAESIGATYLACSAAVNLATDAQSACRYEEAIAIGEKLLADLSALRFGDLRGCVLNNLSNVYRLTGSLSRARLAALEALPLMRRYGRTKILIDTVIQLALSLARPEAAALLCGYMRAEQLSGRWRPTPEELDEHRAALDQLAQTFAADELERWLARGATLTDDQIDALIHELPDRAS